MLADDLDGGLATFVVQFETFVAFVDQQLLFLQFLEHIGHGCGPGLEGRGEGVGGDDTVILLEVEDGFEVIFLADRIFNVWCH